MTWLATGWTTAKSCRKYVMSARTNWPRELLLYCDVDDGDSGCFGSGTDARTAHPNPPPTAPDHATLLNAAEKRVKELEAVLAEKKQKTGQKQER